jgi:two-component system, NtrC family, nitrogen regulation response regulator NtrX
MAQILVVDDEVGIRELLSEILADEGHSVRLAENAAEARRQRGEARPDLVLLDIWMPDTDGISLLKEWNVGGLLTMPVVMMSGHGTIDTAVEATRIGAVDFLEKPIALQKLLATVKKALKHDAIGQRPPLTLDAFARCGLLRDLKKRLEQAAAKTRVLFLRGGTGSMAEICARTLQTPHAPWLDLATVSSPLTQEMLQKAAGGILLVGDLAALGRMQQMNLAFALDRLDKYNLQLLVGSSRPLSVLAEENGWDAALISRIGAIWLAVPDLAQHIDDVPEIAHLLLTLMVERNEVPPRHFSVAALNLLRTHGWSGGTSGGWLELQTLVRNLALTALEEEITEADLQETMPKDEDVQGTPPALIELFGAPLREARDAFEKLYFEHLLHLEGGNMTRVAERSGVERTHLYRKLKQLGVGLGKRSDD